MPRLTGCVALDRPYAAAATAAAAAVAVVAAAVAAAAAAADPSLSPLPSPCPSLFGNRPTDRPTDRPAARRSDTARHSPPRRDAGSIHSESGRYDTRHSLQKIEPRG